MIKVKKISSGSYYEGSVTNVSGTTLSGLIPPSMIENGWQFEDRSKRDDSVWQYIKPLEDGRYNQIRLNNHKHEGVHYHIKIMVKRGEKPTKKQFANAIGPELKKVVKKALEKYEG